MGERKDRRHFGERETGRKQRKAFAKKASAKANLKLNIPIVVHTNANNKNGLKALEILKQGVWEVHFELPFVII